MWAATARSGFALAIIVFVMWVLRTILDEMVPTATAGDHASHESVQQISGYFAAMTLDNLILLGAFAVGIFLVGRAAVERDILR